MHGCIISLDFFKAYDRVFLGFLVKVMDKMNFSSTFIAWVKMLHEGASTCFIFEFLTVAISVTFSIRPGDPLAMLLYIVYVEPLLNSLEKKLSGIQFNDPFPTKEVTEAYCDDINIITNDLNDFSKI